MVFNFDDSSGDYNFTVVYQTGERDTYLSPGDPPEAWISEYVPITRGDESFLYRDLGVSLADALSAFVQTRLEEGYYDSLVADAMEDLRAYDNSDQPWNEE